MKKVTVIIPNYNHARFLDRRIGSVLEQTFQDFELLILDDASTDESLRIIERYAGDPRVTVCANETNSGSPFPQWNKGVRAATGDYVWLAESDDEASPELLGTLVQRLDEHPEAVLAYCQSMRIDDAGAPMGTMEYWTEDLDPARWKSDFVNEGRDECARFLFVKDTIPNASAVLFRREAYLQAGGAPEDMRLAGDWMTWARMLMLGQVVFVAEPLNRFRWHGSSVRESTPAPKFCLEACLVRDFIARQTAVSEQTRTQARREADYLWASSLRHAKQFPSWPWAKDVIRLSEKIWPGSQRRMTVAFWLERVFQSRLGRSLRPAAARVNALLHSRRSVAPGPSH